MAITRYGKYFFSLLTKGAPLGLSGSILSDSLDSKKRVGSNEEHIKEGVEWILRAQSATKSGGVSEMYSLYQGWHGPYSETTGYIIPTFWNYYHKSKDERIKKAAIGMAEWELTKQFDEGAFPGGAIGDKSFPIVFNTGQVLFGMVRSYEETKDKRYLDSMKKSSDWLCSIQHKDGYWEKFEYLEKKHVYNSRVAWPLLLAFKHTRSLAHRKAAINFFEWAVYQQTDSGWYSNNAFYPTQEPLLHTIAYAIQGILEGGIILDKKEYVQSAQIAADALLSKIRPDGSLAGSFDSNWNSSVSWSCLTGNSQMAIVYLRLYSKTREDRYLEAAKKLNSFVKSTQDLSNSNPGIRGGIKGAHPIWGWYAPFCFINWAAKFHIDALMLEDDLKLSEKMS